MKKRIVSILLALAMVLGMIPDLGLVAQAADEPFYTVAGMLTSPSGESAAGIFGAIWEPAQFDNDLQWNTSTNRYEITYTVDSVDDIGSYMFKIVKDHGWDDESLAAPNETFAVHEVGSTVVLAFDGTKALVEVIPPGGSTVTTHVASVTASGVTTSYTNIASAVAAAKASEGSTLKLLDNITAMTTIDSGSFTIDLNGKIWQYASYLMQVKGNSTNIKIIDSSTEKSGKLLGTDNAYTITLYGSANLEIAGGTVENDSRAEAIGMDQFGNPSQATLTVSGGRVVTNGITAISAYGKSVTVTGGTIESGEGEADIYYRTGVIDLYRHNDPTGITIYNNTGEEVTPGENTIKLPDGYVMLDSTGNAANTLVPAKIYTVGKPVTHVASVTAGGVTTNYADIASAVTAAEANTGSTLKLLDDITTDATATIDSGSFTIDLNGKTWRCSDRVLNICGTADIKITDTSVGSTGKLLGTGNAQTIQLYGDANLEIAGGTVENNFYTDAIAMDRFGMPSQATLTVSGGTLVTNGITAISAYGKSVTVTGGTIRSSYGDKRDIDYQNGEIDLSKHSNPTGIKIYIYSRFSGPYVIDLPGGYVLQDEVGNAVTNPEGGQIYTVGTAPINHSVYISAVDVANRAALAGAYLQILDTDDIVVDEWTSISTEAHTVTGLESGVTYTLRAVVAPDGYIIPTDTTFSINADGTMDKSTSTVTVENGILLTEFAKTKVEIKAVDKVDGKEIAGAKMQILNSSGDVVVVNGNKVEWTSDGDVHTVTGLKTGTYTLRTAVAPDGYTIPADTSFTIDADGDVTTTDSMTEDGILLVEFDLTEVEIKAIDVEGAAIEGAHLQILKGANLVEEWVSAVDDESTEDVDESIWEVTGLKTDETFILHTTVAPNGYTIPADTEFSMGQDGMVTTSGSTTSSGVLLVKFEAESAYTITIEPLTNGTVTADKTTAAAGETVTLTVTPDSGHEIDQVTVNGTPIEAVEGVYSFEMPRSNVTVSATFVEPTPVITELTFNQDSEAYDAATNTFRYDEEHSLEVTIRGRNLQGQRLYIAFWNSGNTHVAGLAEATHDTENTVLFRASFLDQVLDLSAESGKPADIVMLHAFLRDVDGPTKYLNLNVVPNTRTVTFVDHDGTELKSETVNYGASATAPADPTREGYTFTGWDQAFDNVTSDLTVTAQYTVKQYTITFDTDGGSVSTNNENPIMGDEVTITITPEPGMEVDEVVVKDEADNELPVTENPDGSYTYEQPAGDVKVEVTMKETEFENEVTQPSGGDIETSDPNPTMGDKVTITVDPDPGMEVGKVTVKDENGKEIPVQKNKDGTYTYIQPIGKVTIEVRFDEIPDPSYTIDNDVPGVDLSHRTAETGEKVYIELEDDTAIEDIVIYDRHGDEVEIKEDKKGYYFKMPEGRITIERVEREIESAFGDVDEEDYFFDAVQWAVENGITNGVGANVFAPNAICTRAQVVTFLWRAAGSPEPKSNLSPFVDVPADAYYYKAVLWAVENGITNGTSADTFSPNATVTRGQTVTFLWRAEHGFEMDGDHGFHDVASDAYYHDAVLWAVENDVTNGTSKTTFSPDNGCTRGQIVTFLYRTFAK